MKINITAIGIDTKAKSICRKARELSNLVCMKKPVARRITQKSVKTTESPDISLLKTRKNNIITVAPMPVRSRTLMFCGRAPSAPASPEALKKITVMAFKNMRKV